VRLKASTIELVTGSFLGMLQRWTFVNTVITVGPHKGEKCFN
jgi:hypothetical protein